MKNTAHVSATTFTGFVLAALALVAAAATPLLTVAAQIIA